MFGPVMLLWFLTLGLLGLLATCCATAAGADRARPRSTACALHHLAAGLALVILGAVFLALTGGEALYADMGHFGSRPVRSPGSPSSGRRCC
jgi:KUP system potassium uptake protein